jgi:hypothetical protein
MTIFELADSVKHYSRAIYKIISFCVIPREISEILAETTSYPEFESYANTPVEVLEWIIDASGLARLPETSEYEATKAGKEFVEEYCPDLLLKRLITREHKYTDILRGILNACKEPKGLGELEDLYKGHPAMVPGKVSVSYFVNELERAGALAWKGGWLLTDSGQSFIQ